MRTSSARALLIRLDRIGDLILTMPSDAAFGVDQCHWWIAAGLEFIADCAEPPRPRTPIPPRPSLTQAWRLWREVRRLRPDVAVVFHAPWWAGFLIWAARVPNRIGPLSQWHSFLFFNRGVRQKRSQSTEHESEYNARLVEDGLGLERGSLPRSPLQLVSHLTDSEQEILLRRHRLRARDYFVVHPGMRGSALNWPTANWESLIRRLSRLAPVAITGTAADEVHLAPLRKRLGADPAIRWLDGQLSSDELLAALANARAMAAPSTGVLHLAASVGARTVGIYSPVLVQAALRWGPQGRDVRAISPGGPCPARFECLGEACARWTCLSEISVDSVLAAMIEEKPVSQSDAGGHPS